MEPFQICSECKLKFDLESRLPKILPCSCTLCLSCLQQKKNEFGDYHFSCNVCHKNHYFENLDLILTSQILTHFLENSNSDPNQLLKQFSDKFIQKIDNLATDSSKHYESVLTDIENRSERLIEVINNSREILQDQINQHRNADLLYQVTVHSNGMTQPNNYEISTLEAELNKILAKTNIEQTDIDRVRYVSDKIQNKIYELKKLLWYFADNKTMATEITIGHVLSKKLDKSFMRIKKLKSLFDENSFALKVNILSEFKLTPLRQEILPLSKYRVVKIYFSTLRSLHFELFDTSTGKCIKTLNAFENLSSFPISYGYGEHFCVCFTSKNKENFHDMNTNFVRLYDIEFNLIKSLQRFASIESVFMNEKYIMLYFSHKSDNCCEVYDYQMNEQFAFGQNTLPTAPFYMEKSFLTMKQQMSLNFKLNPRIFGFTNDLIYMWNYHKVFMMSRKTGEIVKYLNLHGVRPYFLLDNENNIIQVNCQAKKLSLLNNDLELIVENIYGDNLDTVHINKYDQMIFVDMEKKSVIYI